MNVDAYHADPAIGGTSLRDALRSPAHYYARHVGRTAPIVETPAMRLGTAVHCCVLEPDRWASEYIVAPECDRRTKAGKEAHAAFAEASVGRTVIGASDHALAEAIAGAVRAHQGAAALLRAAHGTETPLAWEDASTGLRCKGRVDLVSSDAGNTFLCDLKTTQDASPREFARGIASWSMHVQAAHYMAGWEAVAGKRPIAYVLIAVEKSAPHCVATYALDAAALERGADLRARALGIIAECHRVGAWPGYSDQIETISLPAWAA